MICHMDTQTDGVESKAVTKSKDMKDLLEKSFPSAVARSDVQ